MTAGTKELREKAASLREQAKGFISQAESLENLALEVERQLTGQVTVSEQRKQKTKTVAKKVAKSAKGKKRRATGEEQPALKQILLDILAKHPNGTNLNAIIDEVQKTGYKSNAKSLSQNISTNLYLLRVNSKKVNHDKETRLYSLAKSA